jgi:hypothetical protein
MARFYNGLAAQASREIEFAVQGGTNGTQPTFTGPVFTSKYVKIGRVITFFHDVDFSNIDSFGTGQYYMTIPFAPANEIIFRGGSVYDTDLDREYQISGHVEEGSTTMWLFATDIAGQRLYDYPFDFETPFTLTNSDSFHISGTYFAQ